MFSLIPPFLQVLPLCPAAEAALTAEFKNRRVRKTYIALCCGLAPAHGRINVRLKTISTVTRHFAAPHPGGKEAVTEFKRLALLHPQALNTGLDVEDASSSGSAYSLLLVTPITGRMHQIRAHLNHIGHPLDGDGRYDITNAAAPPLSVYACVPQVCPSQPGRGSIQCEPFVLARCITLHQLCDDGCRGCGAAQRLVCARCGRVAAAAEAEA